ncbi:MAG: hypothetical protein IKZ59_01415 [Clostridia bacterium]|nr:hypothetical protein [Clostridia bacterium]
MSKEIKLSKKEPKSTFFAVVLCECVLAAALIITVTVLKFFVPKAFSAVRRWYTETIATDTDVSEIINGAKNEV